jgi:rfaE bifunctional protein nucleotidyltransferase chain/domain
VTLSKPSASPSPEVPWKCLKLLWDRKSLIQWRKLVNQCGARLVMTNGCFDLVHAGHIRYLRQAKTMGTFLLVLLNSDESVRLLKGPNRPINCEQDRAILLNELECVTAIFVFSDKRVTKWLKLLKPQVWVKGGDYTIDSLDQQEVATARANGTHIEIIPMQGDISTTKILQRV